jgi:molecular chaperone GrpE
MSEETRTRPPAPPGPEAPRPDGAAADAEEFSAAAPPHPAARGTGETSFGDAEAPPAGPPPQSRPTGPDKAAEYLELARRTQADFDNYRKRMARENAAAAERGAGRLAKELLPALDHLEIALKAAEAHTAPAAAGADEQRTPAQGGHEDVIRGFVMVRDELMSALGKVGIESFSPHGEAFDPSEHEAMAQLPVEEAESGTVVEVYQQGYRINGTVLRPARVVVAQ